MQNPPVRAAAIAGIGSIGYRALLALALAGAPAARARDLAVGPGEEFATPSQAARAAAPGDHIRIASGTYYDCAVWTADRLVIEGAGPGTVLTDTACEGKASFVIRGRGITVRDLSFARIRVPDENGAGIRAEAPDLLVERVRFEDDQDGILAAAQPGGGTLQVIGCTFTGIGAPGSPHPSAALLVGAMDQLVVRGSSVAAGRAGSAIVSDARLTTVTDSRLGTAAGPAVQASGGLVVEGSTLQSGSVGGRRAAVLALPEADGDAALALRGNTLGGGGALLLNWSGRAAALAANALGPDGVAESSAGSWSYGARRSAHAAYDGLRGAARHLARQALDLADGR